MSDKQLRVLTLNCWGLKYVSKNRSQRVAAIASELSRSNYDIIALQELWVLADFEHVRASVSDRLPYAKFFYSGALGAGLVIFSRFPFIATSVHPYSLNGAPLDVIAGDWFVGKAAASVVIAHRVLGEVQIFNTHLFAKGGEDGPEHNRAHRLVNAWEFAKLAKHAALMGRYVIALGDFNSVPTTLPMTIIRDHGALTDAWAASHTDPTSSSSLTESVDMTSPQAMITHFGVTADSPLNTYSAGKPLDPHARKFLGKRLDYVLYRQPSKYSAELRKPQPVLSCRDTKVVFTNRAPGQAFSYSDHFGLEATLDIHVTADDDNYASEVESQVLPHLTSASITTTIGALSACFQFSRSRSRHELTIFALCLLLLVGIITGSAWLTSSWANCAVLLVTVFIAWLATTMLYEGFLYGQWELNALMNVIEELEIHRSHLEREHGA